jgi:hypothetical protein
MNSVVNNYSRRLDSFAFFVLLLLSAQGLLNYMFRGTSLESWKQLTVVTMFLLSARLVKSRREQIIFYSAVLSGFMLFMFSIIRGIAMLDAAYNIFFYISWVPFYFFGLKCNLIHAEKKIAFWSFAIIIMSGIGLMLQLYTPYLNFLNDDVPAVEYRSQFGDAQRFGLVFVASTIVLPTLGGFFCLFTMMNGQLILKICCLIFLGIAVIATGSLGSAIMLGGALLIATQRMSLIPRLVFIFCAIFLVIYLISGADDVIKTQLDRIATNDNQSDSNSFRILLWMNAIDLIVRGDIVQHIVGSGLGTTVEGKFGPAPLSHGESSFFQAYLEGGVLGLSLRAMPFILLLRARWAPHYAENLIYGCALFVVCSVAPLFGAYGIQCVLAYIAGIANQKSLLYKFAPRNRQPLIALARV